MFEIISNSKQVWVCILLQVGGKTWEVVFINERSTELDAALLRSSITTEFNKLVSDIRKEAYELGWKDAKAKKIAKRKYFFNQLTAKGVGY